MHARVEEPALGCYASLRRSAYTFGNITLHASGRPPVLEIGQQDTRPDVSYGPSVDQTPDAATKNSG